MDKLSYRYIYQQDKSINLDVNLECMYIYNYLASARP